MLLNCAGQVSFHAHGFTEKHAGRTVQRFAIQADPKVLLGDSILAREVVKNRAPEPGVVVRWLLFQNPMVQRGCRARLAFEAFPGSAAGDGLRQDFDGDIPAQARIARSMHFTHAAGAQRRKDLVGSEPGPCSQ